MNAGVSAGFEISLCRRKHKRETPRSSGIQYITKMEEEVFVFQGKVDVRLELVVRIGKFRMAVPRGIWPRCGPGGPRCFVNSCSHWFTYDAR